jgi:esterase/lipase superfamily enzyme
MRRLVGLLSVVVLFACVVPLRAELLKAETSPHIKALAAVYALPDRQSYTEKEVSNAIRKFRHWVASPETGPLTDAELALLADRKAVLEMRRLLDARVESPDLQRQLISTGILDAKLGEAPTQAIRAALQKFRRATKSTSFGDVTAAETVALQKIESEISAFAGFELIDDKATGRKVLLPKALVGATPVPGIDTAAWTTYTNSDDTIRVHMYKHSQKANSPITMAGRLIEKKKDLNFEFLEVTGDDFTIEANAKSQRGRYLAYSTAWERNGKLSGLGLSIAYDPLPDGISPPQLPDVPSTRHADTDSAAAAAAAATGGGVEAESPAVRNWRRVARVMWNLMTSSFDSSNGWEKASAKECLGKPAPGGTSVPVIYATDRSRVAPAAVKVPPEADQLYTLSRDDKLHIGCAIVWVPDSAKNAADLRALIGRGAVGSKDNDPKAKFNVEEMELVKPVNPFEERDIVIVDSLKTRSQQALLFIHGYNNSFADALLRVAQIAAATGYQGRVYLFSWPSQESRFAYIGDMDYAEQAEIDLEYFLNAILRDADGLELNILAHSMGSQVLLRSIENIRPVFDRRDVGRQRERVTIPNVVFAAPDVSELVFKRKVSMLSRFADRITVYASANDGALDISKMLRGKVPRAGGIHNGYPIEVDGVDVIDITGESLPWYYTDRYFGTYHSAFAFEKPVLEDIHGLLSKRKSDPPMVRAQKIGKPKKFTEMKYNSAGGQTVYWKLNPETGTTLAKP